MCKLRKFGLKVLYLYKLHSQGLINSKKENYVECQLSNNASYQSILVYQCSHDHNSDQICEKEHMQETYKAD